MIIICNRVRGIESVQSELEDILEQSEQVVEDKNTSNARADASYLSMTETNTPTLQHSNPPTFQPSNIPKIIITHGQMPTDDIEDRIHAFKKGKYDILLTTTIIENGVNFLSANTIIILDPEDF